MGVRRHPESEHPLGNVTHGMQWTVNQVNAIVQGGALAQHGNFHHLGRLGRLAGPCGPAQRPALACGRHAVPLRLARRLPGAEPLCEEWLHLKDAALPRQPAQVLRHAVQPATREPARRAVRRHDRLLRLYAEASPFAKVALTTPDAPHHGVLNDQ